MSGNTIGLADATTHIHSMSINWGLSIFAANSAAWNALPADLKALLRQELPKLEQVVWVEAERETGEGVACNTGAASCADGHRGRMTEVRESPADEKRRREIFVSTVLARWVQRCGAQCAEVWNQTIGPVSGFEARVPK
jgi:hypothetical protein